MYQHETYYPEQESKCYTSGDAVKILTKRSLKRQEELKQENATITTTNTTSNATANKTNAAERHIEIMVTLDHAILQYHKSVDIENYVLTVFNMVRCNFHNMCGRFNHCNVQCTAANCLSLALQCVCVTLQ